MRLEELYTGVVFVFTHFSNPMKRLMKKLSLILAAVLFLTSFSFLSAQEKRQRPEREPNTLSEREKTAGFELLFDGKSVDKDIWQGAVDGYKPIDETLVCEPGGNLVTKKEYADFVFRFEFKLPPAGNNGIGIRTKLDANGAYDGHEIQILEDTAEQYKNLEPYQFHGSVYRFVPAIRGSLNPVGEWNTEEIVVYGNKIKVICNQKVIVDADMTEFVEGIKPPMDGAKHIFNKSGVIGFMGHGDPVVFRSIRIKELKDETEANRYLSNERRGGQGRPQRER